MYSKNIIPDNTTYRVVSWDTRQVISTHTKLSIAKKVCRELGYTAHRLVGNVPHAYVECDILIDGIVRTDCCIYNPRFK
jgi:hypothetical protein